MTDKQQALADAVKYLTGELQEITQNLGNPQPYVAGFKAAIDELAKYAEGVKP